ncbi:hypothetical protein [Microbacterium jejuense]|uniref:hypothetical protein n=1 Tax=Microbacterium jejuense TaxID=1263637 RepID=UPI0031F0F2BF
MSEQPSAAPARKSRFTWVRAASDRVPTAWFAAIGTGAFLAATAAFGGLAEATPPPLAVLEPGEAHVTDMRTLTVVKAVLIDELPGSGTWPEDGERVLAIVVDVTNNWDQPLRTRGSWSVEESFSIKGLESDRDLGDDEKDPGPSVARYDDTTAGPILQPGVPAKVVYSWAVDADDYQAGDELEVTLDDMRLYTASFVAQGSNWQDPVPTATMSLPIEDVGAGVEEDSADDD